MKTTEIIKELYTIFNALNDKYFDYSLPTPFITIKQGKTKTKNVYGTFCKKAWLHKDGEKIDENGNAVDVIDEERFHEIAMSGEYLARPFANMCATMCHEMIHLYCATNGIEDTSNKGVYHNAKFKTEAEKRGLIIEKAPTIGWSVTTPTEEFIQFVNNIGVNTKVFDYFRASESFTTSATSKKRWVCPICGQQVSGKKDAKIGCWSCGLQMDFWDLSIEGAEQILVDNNDGLATSEDGWYTL